ncbi:MAG: tetratricopeptide repeat protein [Syntrophobacterales bacterium]|nr:tetratricopeptide repeat protein [Syntrophobacterales bacterium]
MTTRGMLTLVLAGVLMLGPAPVWAQEEPEVLEALVQSYDLLEAGKLPEAKRLYQEILQKHPDHPLALNNLAYIQVKEGDLAGARATLERALSRAAGYRLKVNQVCAVDGICLAFRPGGPAYGDQDLEPLVRLNLSLVQERLRQGR